MLIVLSEIHGIVYHASDPWGHTVNQHFHTEILQYLQEDAW